MPIQVMTLNLADSQKMTDAAIAKAEEIGVPENIVIVDRAGRLLMLVRMDGAKFHSTETATAKAVTAASIGAPSGAAPSDVGITVGVTTQGQFTNLPGGLPVVSGGQVLGAVGVGSGSPAQDVIVAEAAVAALKLD